MGKYVARLTGETDGHTIKRQFMDIASAKAWLQGDGLADFGDQAACGEVLSSDGNLVWRKSHLQTPDRADRNKTVDWRRLFARHNITFKRKTG